MKKIISLISLFALTLFGISFVSAQDFTSCPMGGMMYGNYGFGFGILSWVTYLLVIALIIAAIYWLIKSANKKK